MNFRIQSTAMAGAYDIRFLRTKPIFLVPDDTLRTPSSRIDMTHDGITVVVAIPEPSTLNFLSLLTVMTVAWRQFCSTARPAVFSA